MHLDSDSFEQNEKKNINNFYTVKTNNFKSSKI